MENVKTLYRKGNNGKMIPDEAYSENGEMLIRHCLIVVNGKEVEVYRAYVINPDGKYVWTGNNYSTKYNAYLGSSAYYNLCKALYGENYVKNIKKPH